MIKKCYFNGQDGLSGNDDLGDMDSYYIFFTIGKYLMLVDFL
ncbi:glycoside hydrolase domain-containing protein [Arachidicoccus rhizosphaerae]